MWWLGRWNSWQCNRWARDADAWPISLSHSTCTGIVIFFSHGTNRPVPSKPLSNSLSFLSWYYRQLIQSLASVPHPEILCLGQRRISCFSKALHYPTLLKTISHYKRIASAYPLRMPSSDRIKFEPVLGYSWLGSTAKNVKGEGKHSLSKVSRKYKIVSRHCRMRACNKPPSLHILITYL